MKDGNIWEVFRSFSINYFIIISFTRKNPIVIKEAKDIYKKNKFKTKNFQKTFVK